MQRVTLHIPIRNRAGALHPFALLASIRHQLIEKYGGLLVIPDARWRRREPDMITSDSVEVYIVDIDDIEPGYWIRGKIREWTEQLDHRTLYATTQEIRKL